MDLNSKEKAFLFARYQVNRIYFSIALLGLGLTVFGFFQWSIDETALVAMLVGGVMGWLDMRFYFHLLTRRTEVYANGFNRYGMLYPYRNVFPFSLHRRAVRVFSHEWRQAFLVHLENVVIYSSYKIIILLFTVVSAFLLATTAGRVITDSGISLLFLGFVSMVAWNRIFARRLCRHFKISAERMDQIARDSAHFTGWDPP